jgi:hypothetical protein
MSPLSKLRLTRTAWVLAVAGAITGWSALYLMEDNNPNGVVILDQLGPGYRAYWVLALAACLCLGISIPLRRHILRVRQQLNEVAAKQMLESLRTATAVRERQFFVYLRSFETTGHLKPPFFFTLLVLQRLHTNELESFLALALAKDGPLLGLGLPGENVGAARIRVEDSEWKEDIQRLLTHAAGVLLLPSAHEGTKWEIEFLQKQGMFDKTVLIMPPRTHQFDWRAKWQETAKALQELSITLPEYNERGLLFTLSEQNRVADARMFSLFYRRSIRKSIHQLLRRPKLTAVGDEAVRKAEHESRFVWFYGKWVTVVSSLITAAFLVWTGMSGVLFGRAATGVNPPPPWSTFAGRYNSASEVGSGQSLVDAQVLLTDRRALPESQIDRLANDGLARVSDSDREMYLLGRGELLSHAPNEGACAALAEGRSSELARTRTLVTMPDTDVRLWMTARQSAALATLRNRPVMAGENEASGDLKRAVAAALGGQVAADLDRSLSATRRLTNKEACELGVAGGAALYRLQEPYRAQFAGILANHFAKHSADRRLPSADIQ